VAADLAALTTIFEEALPMNAALIVALVVTLVVTVTLATVRTVRADRPHPGPGTPQDWREEALRWRLLGIA
jgi:hypothetical protein